MVFLNGWICLWGSRQKLLSAVNLKIDFTINCDNRYVRRKVVSIQKNTVWTFLNVNWQSLSMGEFYFHFLHIFTITLPLNIFAIALNVVFSSKAKKSFHQVEYFEKHSFLRLGKEELFERNSWNCNEVMLIQWILRKFFSTCFQLLDVSGSLCIFCLKSNLLNVGKKSPFRIKENAHINSYKAILFDRMWSVWIVCILVLEWAVQNL